MYFPRNFSVCGVGFVRNSVDELFVEGTCNVFGVDVCVVFAFIIVHLCLLIVIMYMPIQTWTS